MPLSFQDDCLATLRARIGLWIVTREESRCEQIIISLLKNQINKSWEIPVNLWSAAQGVSSIKFGPSATTGQMEMGRTDPDEKYADPRLFLQSIMKTQKPGIWILYDIKPWISEQRGNPALIRLFKEVVNTVNTKRLKQWLIFIDTEEAPKVQGIAAVALPLPEAEDRKKYVELQLRSLQNSDEILKKVNKNGGIQSLVDATAGLTQEQVSSVICKGWSLRGYPKAEEIQSMKRQIIAGTAALRWMDPNPLGMAAVGGMEPFKQYVQEVAAAYTQEALDYGVPRPKGAMITGVPGCGKSYVVSCLATVFQKPLLDLNVGGLFSKFQGEAEANLREVKDICSTIAPCIVRLEEIEKAFVGTAGAGSDGGVGARLFGDFLTWMAENEKGIFFAATANDVTELKNRHPEFFRTGRFDSIWWVDIPNREERIEIIKVMQKRYPHCAELDIEELADVTHQYTGSEIEGAFVQALRRSFIDGSREVRNADLIATLAGINRITEAQSSSIASLREWGRKEARGANTPSDNELELLGTSTREVGISN